jgi:hypothetical protein
MTVTGLEGYFAANTAVVVSGSVIASVVAPRIDNAKGRVELFMSTSCFRSRVEFISFFGNSPMPDPEFPCQREHAAYDAQDHLSDRTSEDYIHHAG